MSSEQPQADQFQRLTERIERVREDLALSRRAFCQRIGFPYGRYHHITGERQSKPTADLLTAVVTHTDVNAAWLLAGEGPPYRGSGASGIPAGALEGQDYVLIPLYGVETSAGDGQWIASEEVEDLLAFKREWITRELRAGPENLALIHVQGESMVPTLNPGDVILLERYARPHMSDGIFVIRMGEALLVKRLQFLPEGELRVSSDNPAYRSFAVNLRTPGEDFQIIGRVVWAGRRF